MPLKTCSAGGKPGIKFGTGGKCYSYKAGSKSSQLRAKKKAIKQGLAISRSTGEKFRP
jgi:hypothetical protein